MSTRAQTIVFDFLAGSTGGQLPRARAFLERFRHYDPHSRAVVLRQRGTLDFCDGREDLEMVDVAAAASTARRLLWQATSLDRFLGRCGAEVFISFSHAQPRRWRGRGILSVLNMAPFSAEAARAETLRGRLRLRALRRLVLAAAGRAHAVVALSEASRQALVAEAVDPDKIVVVPNGVADYVRPMDREAARRVLEPMSLGEDYLLYVSHFYRYKNFERLVLAYGRLPEALRRRHRLVLVGRPMDRSYSRRIQALIAEHELRSQVTVVPGVPHERMAALQAGAALFVFPSLVENCPNALLEAMRCGTPIVCSSLPSMPEFAQDAALYFDPLSVDSLTDALTQALEDESLRTALGRRALELSEPYTWDSFTRKMVGLYQAA